MSIKNTQIKKYATDLAYLTVEVSNSFLAVKEGNTLEKMNWSFLHIGYVYALRQFKVNEQDGLKIINQTNEILKSWKLI